MHITTITPNDQLLINVRLHARTNTNTNTNNTHRYTCNMQPKSSTISSRIGQPISSRSNNNAYTYADSQVNNR